MSKITFKQDSDFGWETFVLDDDRLIICKKALSFGTETVIKISDVSSDYERGKGRLGLLYMVPLTLSIIALVVTVALVKKDLSLGEELPIFPAALTVVFLWHTIKGYRPIDLCRFKDKNGKVLFELFKPRKSSPAYEEFIAALISALTTSRTKKMTWGGQEGEERPT